MDFFICRASDSQKAVVPLGATPPVDTAKYKVRQQEVLAEIHTFKDYQPVTFWTRRAVFIITFDGLKDLAAFIAEQGQIIIDDYWGENLKLEDGSEFPSLLEITIYDDYVE